MRRREEIVYDEAFATRGLPSLPVREHSTKGTERLERPRKIMTEHADKSERRRQHDQERMPPPEKRIRMDEDATSFESHAQEDLPPPAGRDAPVRKDPTLNTIMLADNYIEINPSEITLLRDLPFTLQGLTSASLVFTLSSKLKLPPTLPPPIISMLHTLAEPSLLYKGLMDFVDSSDGGLLCQSLRAAVAEKLRSYLGLVAQIEGQIRRALSTLDENAPRNGLGKTGVTLKRCVIWTREATMVLRLLSLIAEESKSKKGGQLISLIHGFASSHGDPLVGTVAEQLLTHVTRPFYDILRQWIYDGELSDPYLEFFVHEQDPHAVKTPEEIRARGASSSVWEDKYKIEESMIPSIITEDFAHKVFLIGKSLNFIRHGCGDSLWVDEYSKDASKELRYGDTETLEAWIDEAYKTTMARLIYLMDSKFHLFSHLRAHKDYLLLGHGDFITLLMESLSKNLDRPAGVQYRHTLTAQLDHAIRGSNAQFDSDETKKRLDARMLHFSHGELGWDCFTLEYKIDAPVDVVVTEWGSKQYLKVFNFLWRIKRVEFMLTNTWRKTMTGARGPLKDMESVGAGEIWRTTKGCIAEMIHFIGQLQYYILFEVIQSSWDELQAAIHKENCTLDDIIRAHTKYLVSITHKGLLGAHKKGADGKEESAFMKQLNDLLHVMLAYRDAVDGLYAWSVAEFARSQDESLRRDTGAMDLDSDDEMPPPASTRRGVKHLSDSFASTPISGTIPGLPGYSASALGDDGDNILTTLTERLRAIGGQFKIRLSVLLGDLAYQPDQGMRYLGVTMNFNDFYQARRRPTARPAGQVSPKKPTAASDQRPATAAA